ncbi:MAG TPA: LamG-like jellyroll fold domain-containing protein [Rhodanobacteraceae bacterium]
MGGSKKQTIGYKYPWAMHFGWCRAADALLELQAGGKTAWIGRLTASGPITINKPDLWGGDSQQGGVVGEMDVMFGEATQTPNDYLTAVFGSQQSAHRGKFTTVWRGGIWGSFIPNPQPLSAKIECILADWPNDSPWYAEKAVINMPAGDATTSPGYFRVPAGAIVKNLTTQYATVGAAFVGTAQEIGAYCINARNAATGSTYTPDGGYLVQDINGVYSISGYSVELGPLVGIADVVVEPVCPEGTDTSFVAHGPASNGITNPTITCTFTPSLHAMNPAHMLYLSIVDPEMENAPASAINDASFRAAADQLYAEGFGLCTIFDSSQETPEQFRQRICNIIGANCSQSRIDGLYYLDLIRGSEDPASLPIIGEGDVIEFSEDPSVATETTNMMQVEWFDPQAKEERTTPPVYAQGSIRSAGTVIADSKQYHEIPTEGLALRVAGRDLKAQSTPLSRFDLTVLRKYRALRRGQGVRLQLPSEGIADMICVVGDVSHGTQKDGRMKLKVVQDVFGLPTTVYINTQPPLWTPSDTTPVASPHQVAMEAPYIELAASLSAADLQALTMDAGYLFVMATRPSVGINYALSTAAGAEAYEQRGSGDWCGNALINEAAGMLDTAFTLSSWQDLDRVDVGTWALWGAEIVRVDAIDATAGTLTLGRGCADTVPVAHAAGERIYFCGDYGASDQREYVDADVVNAKLLSRSATTIMDSALAMPLQVTMAQRAALPYAPGDLQFNGVRYPAAIANQLQVSWTHRDRLLQADQLVDALQASVGPEAGTTYDLFLYGEDGLLKRTETGLSGPNYTWTTETTDSQVVDGSSPGDPFFTSVVSLLHFNGANGSTIFSDMIAGRTWTANGDAKISTAQSKWGGASGSFTSTGYIATGDLAFWKFLHDGSTPWTLDTWVRLNSASTTRMILSTNGTSSNNVGVAIFTNASGQLRFQITRGVGSSPVIDYTTTPSLPTGTWKLVSFQWDPAAASNNLKVYIDGALVGSASKGNPFSSANPTYALQLGGNPGGTLFCLNGYLDDLRITQALRYSSDFALPTGPWPDAAAAYRLNGNLRVRLRASRDGLTSFQEHDVTFDRAGYGLQFGNYFGGV